MDESPPPTTTRINCDGWVPYCVTCPSPTNSALTEGCETHMAAVDIAVDHAMHADGQHHVKIAGPESEQFGGDD